MLSHINRLRLVLQVGIMKKRRTKHRSLRPVAICTLQVDEVALREDVDPVSKAYAIWLMRWATSPKNGGVCPMCEGRREIPPEPGDEAPLTCDLCTGLGRVRIVLEGEAWNSLTRWAAAQGADPFTLIGLQVRPATTAGPSH